MSDVVLGFRAYDPHELLLHAVARGEGCYADEGLTVRLRDLTFDPDPAPPVQVSCGSAALAAEAGSPVAIVLVACERPLFFLVGSAGNRVASFPPASPAARFLERMRPDLEQVPARDDLARLGLLREGHVDAALVSTAVPLPRLDVPLLAWLGEELRTPTTGLAVSDEADHGTVARLARAHARALDLVVAETSAARAALRDVFGYDEREAAWLLGLGAFGAQ